MQKKTTKRVAAFFRYIIKYNYQMNTYYNQFFEKGQQVINFNFYKIGLSPDDPVYTLKNILEDFDFSSLLTRYSNKGRKGYNPIMLFAVLLYANMRGIRAVDRIVELCERDIAFIWLTQGEKPQRDTFYSFLNDKLTKEILDDLHYQFIKILKEKGLVSLKTLFIDGTKIEANANRYTFVWRGTVNYHLAGLLENIDKVYLRYNQFLESQNYDVTYKIQKETMFIVEGIERVKSIISKNKSRKSLNLEKISNNSIIKIDNIYPLKLIELKANLTRIANAENILFVHSKGKRKSELQKIYEEIEEVLKRLVKYKKYFEVMGSDRNSFSKTDIEATFMRMKDDHMQNGQLKPAYNVQIAVENYFLIHTYVSNDRTDYNTLIPLLEKHKSNLGSFPDEVTADSGYSSEQNLLFLKENNINSYIKLQMHEKMKTRAYKKDIGKFYNMEKVTTDKETYFICKNSRRLNYQRSEYRNINGYRRNFEVYTCENCSGCEFKSQCLYKYNPEKDINKNKSMKINSLWETLKLESHNNIQSEKGILYRQIRSIQTEGHFGDIKENDNFRRFNHRSAEKVYKEFLLYAVGRNLNKYHRFLKETIKKYEAKIA